METLGESRLQTFLESGWLDGNVTNHDIRSDAGLVVSSFQELVEKVARLAYYNRDHVLLFRGQDSDYPNRGGNTSIHPSILRGYRNLRHDSWINELHLRFEKLKRAETELVECWRSRSLPDLHRLQNHRSLRWAILQHYEVCPTPLLDVTHSLRVAASFASHGTSGKKQTAAYFYVLAVPQISGAITASAEAELQIFRLSSICPPAAQRPHFQEGYLLGHYPEIQSAEEKERYDLYTVDFARRLLCKFRLDLTNFWRRSFPIIPKTALYPQKDDPLLEIAESLRASLAH